MPFHKEDGKVSWFDSSQETEAQVLDAILNNRKDQVEIPMTSDLQSKLEQAITSSIPSSSGHNKNLYTSLKSIATSSRDGVDIILPVYGSIHIVNQCIHSVLTRTHYPYHLYIIDDASDKYTNSRLAEYADKFDHISLVTNPINKGFAASVNKGMKLGGGKYVCLLNSDVLVTPGWLTKMVAAIEADPRNQIVNPATNNTALINVEMSPGASYLDMNTIFEKFAQRRYPEIMPTGFLYMFRRSLISEVGFFDETYENYGEESDHWMRTISFTKDGVLQKYKAVMADDTYVFHERGSSFSSLGASVHMSHRNAAGAKFRNSWPQYGQWIKSFKVDRTLGPLRETVPITELNNIKEAPYRVCWVVRSADFCGGMKYIADLVNEINEIGGDARVALICRTPGQQNNIVGELRTGVHIFQDEEEFVSNFQKQVFKNGFVIAATAEISEIVKAVCEDGRKLTPVLHIQSYEPDLVDSEEEKEKWKEGFKTIPHVISSSNWISERIKEEQGIVPFATISPGVDTKLFYPREREGRDDRPTVMIALRKGYAFKGYDRGIDLIKAVWNQAIQKQLDIRILTYGEDNVSDLKGVANNLGPLSQVRLAKILSTEVDVFIDPTTVHSYGMPALEAMASGVAVVSWDNKGIREYVKQGKNGIIHKRKTPAHVVAESVIDLILDTDKRSEIVKNGLETVHAEHDRVNLVSKFIEEFQNHMIPKVENKSVLFITPHMRKHGGPTTIINLANGLSERGGYDVRILSIYDDINPEISAMTELPILVGPNNVPPCNILISNSDNPFNNQFFNMVGLDKKVMLKLSHNERFKEIEDASLQLGWDKIVTTTKWLVDCCENPKQGWNHPSVPATRIGWHHYGHEAFKCPPASRTYGKCTPESPLVIGMLVHQHPLKGSQEAVDALISLKAKYNMSMKVIGVGEIPPRKVALPNWIEYMCNLNREEMAELFRTFDIWLGTSHTEGLGRLALECMSAGVACVLSDTSPEFAKDKENCMLVPVGNIDGYTKALEELIKYPDLRKKLSVNGYKTAESRSDSTACIDSLHSALKNL